MLLRRISSPTVWSLSKREERIAGNTWWKERVRLCTKELIFSLIATYSQTNMNEENTLLAVREPKTSRNYAYLRLAVVVLAVLLIVCVATIIGEIVFNIT